MIPVRSEHSSTSTRSAVASASSRLTDIYFDDSALDQMSVGNTYYEVRLSKINGAIIEIIDKVSGNVSITLGSLYQCLWGAEFVNDHECGYGYHRAGANRFTYSWNPNASILTLNYTWEPGAPRRLDVAVLVSPSMDRYFDLRLTVQHYRGTILRKVLFPARLSFANTGIQAGYGPFSLPGIRLEPGFFLNKLPNINGYVPPYPSEEAFADYLALDVNGGRLALYTINPLPNPIQPTLLGFQTVPTDTTKFYADHTFATSVADGSTWTSPVVRMRIGQAPQQTIQWYKEENGISAYRSASDKLGSNWNSAINAPLVMAHARNIAKPFRQWIDDFDRLPSPGFLHLVGYQPGALDENNPDFLPPDPLWGTTQDLRAMVDAAQARGILVMPYINPTWWDDESPTMQNLPPPITVNDIAVRNRDGQLVYDRYGENGRYGGWAVFHQAPYVQERLSRLMEQWRTDVLVSCIFEDQIGARGWQDQQGVWYATPEPGNYSNGWYEHTANYVSRCLMTEAGWDRLASTEAGFHGSVLSSEREYQFATNRWGASNWKPYPLGTSLFHDKALLYQHNLHLSTLLPLPNMSDVKEIITWDMAFGLMLSYHWRDSNSLDNQQLKLVSTLQRAIASRYAGRPLVDYSYLNADVTRTTFDNMSVTANWHRTLTYDVDDHRVSPLGFYANAPDGSVLAGVFTDLFNGRALSAGDHYLVVERTPNIVTVRQPELPGANADTDITVDPPTNIPPGYDLYVWALGSDGRQLGSVSYTRDGPRVRFNYSQTWYGQPVSGYELLYAPCPLSFSDVHSDNPFYRHIIWMGCRSYISGYSDGTFRPGNSVTRGQLLKMVVNAAGWEQINPPTPTFGDAPPDSTFYVFIETGVQYGIITGYPCGSPGEPCDPQQRPYFRPSNDVTRSQLSKVIALARVYQLPMPSIPTFNDVPTDHPFYRFIEAMSANGIVTGYPCGSPGEPCDAQNRPYFRPMQSATRGQVVKFVTVAYGGP